MKKQLRPSLLIVAALCTIFTACQKTNNLAPSLSPKFGDDKADVNFNSASPGKPLPVTITEEMDFSTNPAFGTFTATGAINTSGTVVFNFYPNANFMTAHNVVVLTSSEGTITYHDECEFAPGAANPFGRGNWQIVSGTGAYANLKGNGAEAFPSATEDLLTGTVQ